MFVCGIRGGGQGWLVSIHAFPLLPLFSKSQAKTYSNHFTYFEFYQSFVHCNFKTGKSSIPSVCACALTMPRAPDSMAAQAHPPHPVSTQKARQDAQHHLLQREELVRTMHQRRNQASSLKSQVRYLVRRRQRPRGAGCCGAVG